MKKIIISCAPAGTGRGSNLGMNTVDFAIENIVKKNNLEDYVSINRPWESYFLDANNKYPNHKARDFELTNTHYNNFNLFDIEKKPKAIMYWGDFQHGLDFQIQTSKRLKNVAKQKKIFEGLTEDEFLQKTKEYFLLNKNFKENNLPFDVAMYGVTLFQNGLNDYLNEEYFENLKWLYKNSIFSKSRESYSANTISFLKNNYKDSFLGVDCALLNTKDELLSLTQNEPKEFGAFNNNIGVFFGRSTKSLSKIKLLKFLNKISKKTGKDLVRLPWNYFSGGLLGDNLGVYTKGLRNYHSLKGIEFTAGDIFKGMSNLSLIITDTYHVAINAIALNIPVVCLYEPSPQIKRDANMGHRYAWRDKRALLFQTNNMSDFLVSSEDLKREDIRNEKIDNIISLINNKELTNISYANLHNIAKNDRKTISELLIKLSKD